MTRSDTDAVFNADALLTLVEEEHQAFDLVLTLRCLGCPWRRTVPGFVEASVVGQAHQVLHAQCSPWVPTITLREGVHAASSAELATWTMPAWRATGAETIEGGSP